MLRRALCIFGIAVLSPALLHAQSNLEVPGSGAYVSGLGDITGWKCNTGTLTYTVDGGSPGNLVSGVDRLDTESVCDDRNNGFIAQFNWNLLSSGQHTVRVFDNGIQFAQATFTVTTLGAEFLIGQSGSTTLTFAGKQVTLRWQESQQNFAIVGVTGGPPSSGNFNGIWDVTFCLKISVSSCHQEIWKIVQNGTSINISYLYPPGGLIGCTASDSVSFKDLSLTGDVLTGTEYTDYTEQFCSYYSFTDFVATLDAGGQAFSGPAREDIYWECDPNSRLDYNMQGIRSTQCF